MNKQKARKILSFALALVMMLSASIIAYAEDTVTLDLANGPIDITEAGYTQNSSTTSFTGKYIIKGSCTADSPLDIANNSEKTVTFDITLDNAEILASVWCTAVRIQGTGDIILNIYNTGSSKIEAFNHPAFEVQEKINVDINVTNADGATLTLKNKLNSNPQVFGGSKPMTVTIDNVLVDGNGGEHTAHSLALIIAKEPTKDVDGNIEHYCCSVCGLCFLDESGTQSIPKANTVLKKNTRTLSVTYDVAPTYTVTIPATVELGETAEIKAENVVVEKGSQVEVKLTDTSEANNSFKLKSNEGAELAYTVNNGTNNISVGDTVLAVNPDDTSTGAATLIFTQSGEAEFAGDYSGTVTFTVSVESV